MVPWDHLPQVYLVSFLPCRKFNTKINQHPNEIVLKIKQKYFRIYLHTEIKRSTFDSSIKGNKMKTTEQKIAILLTALKVEELKSFLVTCPDVLTDAVLAELETRMTAEEFVQFSNEF